MIEIAIVLKDANWSKKEPAKPELAKELARVSAIRLPKEYFDLLLYSNGGEGRLALDPGWFQLWTVEEVLGLNRAYEIDKNLPGYFGFASSGGGELLGFDCRQGEPYKVVKIPFIPMIESEAVIIAKDFEEFIRAIGREMK